MQRQINLINKANISTIHSFCLDIIRNNFYELNISNNFRVADATEIELMKYEVLEDEKVIRIIRMWTHYE